MEGFKFKLILLKIYINKIINLTGYMTVSLLQTRKPKISLKKIIIMVNFYSIV